MYKCPIVGVWYIQSRQYQYRHISHRTQQTAEYWGRQTSKISSSHLMTPWEKKVQYWENTEVRRQRTKCSRPATLRHPFPPPEPRLYGQSTCLIKGYSFGVTPVCDFFFLTEKYARIFAFIISPYKHYWSKFILIHSRCVILHYRSKQRFNFGNTASQSLANTVHTNTIHTLYILIFVFCCMFR